MVGKYFSLLSGLNIYLALIGPKNFLVKISFVQRNVMVTVVICCMYSLGHLGVNEVPAKRWEIPLTNQFFFDFSINITY